MLTFEIIRFRKRHIFLKVWGEEWWIVNNDKYCGKQLTLHKGWQCSLHHHKLKDETFFIVSGEVRLEFGEEVSILKPGDTVHIPVGVKHRFGGIEESVIIEFSTHHEESDSYREEGELSRYNPDLLGTPE